MSGHAQDVDSSGVYFYHEQDIESAQCDGDEGEEVGGQQPSGLCLQEASPPGVCSAWRRPEAGAGQDPADGACA